MSDTPMHFRTDGSYFETDDGRPAPEPGDTWRIFWYHEVDGQQVDDQMAGYAICCPKCRQVHAWDRASNCPRIDGSCVHEKARTSCWTWSGSAEENKLSAQPSLLSQTDLGGCGWHGFLTNGVLTGD